MSRTNAAISVKVRAFLPWWTSVELLSSGQLDPQIGWRGSWEQIADAAQALLSRQIAGKAVLDVVGQG